MSNQLSAEEFDELITTMALIGNRPWLLFNRFKDTFLDCADEAGRLQKELEEAQHMIKELQEGNKSACESREIAVRKVREITITSNQNFAKAYELVDQLAEAQQTIARLETKLQASRDSVYNISVEGDEARAERNELKAQLADALQTNLQLQAALQQVKSYTHPGWQDDLKSAKDALYHISQLVEGRE